MTTAAVERTVRLRFGTGSGDVPTETHQNLSAVRTDGTVLWLAGDESATVERLVGDDDREPTQYGDHATFRLAELVQLPGADEEADIEGLARSGRFLWAVGSHSLRRKNIKDKHSGAKAVQRLAKVKEDPNRQVLLRIPLQDAGGLPSPVGQTDDGNEPEYAAVLGGSGTSLRDLLVGDELLAPFLPIPGKDNGLDIEGLAVRGDRVHLGLRGPVLRGWAVVLELRPAVDPDQPRRLRLLPVDDDGATYRKHVLDLAGLGVRDLCPAGDDLLVLAGPTMDLDGPVRIYRWRDAWSAESAQVVRGDTRVLELDLPHGAGDDHAEGIALLGTHGDTHGDTQGDTRLLVVYDSPAAHRMDGDTVLADVIRFPKAAS
jgi:hypothetical protein